ncbi:helix-turn-helix domain-containing protein [Streptomyces sp. AV19]|uniref:helix-turn-helix domain-containing protein n=1 Tax=Streptomyces sp. AV19 TaxID=2793068 RepID=UPI0018FE6F0A|nr:helix-turn-helix domain-containing protein [Streptomyces sp. AV19]MBH1934139.1 helix-turn-helix domain-containing protein [Streptomyces sp. AV19]MDG4537139.1 helix-turn-helix domain-containing protein [Streptomyces sp. AV19]
MLETYPEVLTADEVAEVCRVETRVVRRLAAAGELPGFKVGKEWRFHRVDVATFITPEGRSKPPG